MESLGSSSIVGKYGKSGECDSSDSFVYNVPSMSELVHNGG